VLDIIVIFVHLLLSFGKERIVAIVLCGDD
jgi:hypothetical protein